MSKHSDKIKQAEDEKLMALVEKLQQEISLSKGLDNTTLDMSDDNIVADKILRAEYAFYTMRPATVMLHIPASPTPFPNKKLIISRFRGIIFLPFSPTRFSGKLTL